MLFIQVILPVFLIASAGYVFERRSEVDISSLANSALYLFAPSLVFSALVKSTVATGLLGRLTIFMLVYTLMMCALAVCIARFCKFDKCSISTRGIALK